MNPLIKEYRNVFDASEIEYLRFYIFNKAPVTSKSVDDHMSHRTEWLIHRDNLPKKIYNKFVSFVEDANQGFGMQIDPTIPQTIYYSIYPVGGRVDAHIDSPLFEMLTGNTANKLSLVLCLRKAAAGGLLNFYYSEKAISLNETTLKYTVSLDEGDLVVFPSLIFHEVTEITDGVRESINFFTKGPKLV